MKGTAETRKNLISSIFLEPDDLEAHQRKLEAKYMRAQQTETRCEDYCTEDAEILLVGYGIVSRVLRSAVEAGAQAGNQGRTVPADHAVAVPVTRRWRKRQRSVQKVLVVELSNGQMVEDVRLALNGQVPVEFYGRVGGNVPSVEEIAERSIARAWRERCEAETLATLPVDNRDGNRMARSRRHS